MGRNINSSNKAADDNASTWGSHANDVLEQITGFGGTYPLRNIRDICSRTSFAWEPQVLALSSAALLEELMFRPIWQLP